MILILLFLKVLSFVTLEELPPTMSAWSTSPLKISTKEIEPIAAKTAMS